MDIDANLYNGIFFCVNCEEPIHVYTLSLENGSCRCKGKSFISFLDYDLRTIMEDTKQRIEEEGIKL